jgi:DNA repair exonuclease SbcCD ATPase subunit
MCDKQVYSDAAWLEERLRLSREHHYQDNPEYVKTMKCRRDVLRKSDCNILFKGPTSGEYLKKLKQYESLLDKLKELRITLEKVKDEHRHVKSDFLGTQDLLKNASAKVKKLVDALSKRSEKQRERDQQVIDELKLDIDYAQQELPTLTVQFQQSEDRIQQLNREIEEVKLKLKTKPSTRCSHGYKRNKTTKKCDKK